MGFFDDLIGPGEPEEPQPEFIELGPAGPDTPRDRPRADWYLPAVLPEAREVGAGPHIRVMLTGFAVWPDSVTVQLRVFARRVRTGPMPALTRLRPQAGGFRAGLLFADGRRVTTLDGDPWPTPRDGGVHRPTLRPLGGGRSGGFHYGLDLYLSTLPPEGRATLVIEWPDEGVPETRTELDASALREAAERAVEIWPDLPPRPTNNVGRLAYGGGQAVARPVRSRTGGPPRPASTGAPRRASPASDWAPSPRTTTGDPRRYQPRGDWRGVGFRDWADLELVQSRLASGADPAAPIPPWGSPLHLAAARGSAEVIAELVLRTDRVDITDHRGHTPLWEAVCGGRAANAAVLLAAGADAWRPLIGEWSPGRLALVTPLASLFERLPGARPLAAGERAAQRAADELIEVFRGVEPDVLGVAFIAGIGEEEAIRRLGGDPDRCPVLDLAQEPGRYGTGPYGFDPTDFEQSRRYVGVTGVDGDCVLTQPTYYLPSDEVLLSRISVGTVAYGVFCNPGETVGTYARDGRIEREELSLGPGPDSPPEHWLFRFWESGERMPFRARYLAYAAARAGVRITETRPVTGPPRRWVEID